MSKNLRAVHQNITKKFPEVSTKPKQSIWNKVLGFFNTELSEQLPEKPKFPEV